MKKLFLFGASGHARVVLDIIDQTKDVNVDYLLDDDHKLHNTDFSGVAVIGGESLLSDDRLNGLQGLVTIGDNRIRQNIYGKIKLVGLEFANAIHPAATIASTVNFGVGNVIAAGVVINPSTSILDNTIINTSASVDHDCFIGSHVHIAPGCHICGHVTVGDGALLGAGSVVIPSVTIGEHAVIGAGATVTRDIQPGETVIGTPAMPVDIKY